MKHIAIGIDCDGCIIGPRYIHPFTPEVAGDIRKNTSIIDTNSELWDFILSLCGKNPDLETLTLLPFSRRDTIRADALASHDNKTESYFLMMEKIETHLTERLKKQAPNVTVKLNKTLMPDIYNNRPYGHTWQQAMSLINYSSTGLGRMSKLSDNGDESFNDNSKLTFVFAHTHMVDAEAFYYFDDLREVHQAIRFFYHNPFGAALLPNGVKIATYRYDEKGLQRQPLNETTGTGHRDERYADLLKCLQKQYQGLPLHTEENNYRQIVGKFFEIRYFFQNPYPLKSNPLVQNSVFPRPNDGSNALPLAINTPKI